MTLSAGSETIRPTSKPLRFHISLQDMLLSPLRDSAKSVYWQLTPLSQSMPGRPVVAIFCDQKNNGR
jgi:hypothetical protein